MSPLSSFSLELVVEVVRGEGFEPGRGLACNCDITEIRKLIDGLF